MSQNVCIVPGKLHLTGEHSIVYGEPALLAAIGLKTTAKVRIRKDSEIHLFSKQLKGEKKESVDSIKSFYKKAKRAWKVSQGKDTTNLNSMRKDRFVIMKMAVGEFLNKIGKVDVGVRIEVDSKIPVGSGLGSSASVGAAIIGSLFRAFGVNWSLGEINKLVYEVEKIMHGNPSGGDNTAVIYGGYLQFQKINNKFCFKKLASSGKLDLEIFLVDSGKPVETTGEMVEAVNSKFQIPNSKFKNIVRQIGMVSKKIISDFEKGRFNKNLVCENERLLEKLEVVGEKAMKIIQSIEAIGAVAKICGAGGIKKGSGILLAFDEDSNNLEIFLKRSRLKYYTADLGVEGMQ